MLGRPPDRPGIHPALLAELLGDENDWRSQGACVGADYRLFEPSADGERMRGYPPRAVDAGRVCLSCPVIERCRAWAEDRKEQGVWAAAWRTGIAGDNRPWPIRWCAAAKRAGCATASRRSTPPPSPASRSHPRWRSASCSAPGWRTSSAWAEGKGNVSPEIRAGAVRAIAEWEALRAKAASELAKYKVQ
ncbi:WhiB family transcriptional regulator [Pseudonocardia xinjiangensis]|uniref:WhiB family transcriptional regulator n=1 Tax=Pseudonocardia xinjiangensis TaxID=75289 RepID=A0ABX1RD92_9PSEU|nr:WhiB family transcriptional regulator [Pseudonocardia xinjiangensis]